MVALPKHASVVVIGDMNPAIFHPEWFRRHDLVPEYELGSASGDTAPIAAGGELFVTNDFTVIPFKSMRLEVTRERWALSTERTDWMSDLGPLAMSILSKLRETPYRTVGLNVIEHRRVDSERDQTLRHWIPLESLAGVVGENATVSGTALASWNEFKARTTLEASIHDARALYILQNFERKLASFEELRTALALWKEVLARAEAVARAISRSG